MEISSDERLAKLALWNLVAADGVNITGDVDFLLDYAIIGHPKTATTFTNLWFQTHPQVRSFREEITLLSKGYPAEMVKKLHQLSDPREYPVIRGYKYPRDIQSSSALQSISTHWPSAKLIVGVRHPVLWFESFYNL